MTTLSLIIDWYGPFDDTPSAIAAAKENGVGEALYAITGKLAHKKTDRMQYVGISNNLKVRFYNHPKIDSVERGIKFWVGQVKSHAIPGRKSAKHPTRHSRAVDLAEYGIAYLLQLPLNQKKKKSQPKESFVLLSRWFKVDFETRHKQRAHDDWPDFIEYDPDFAVLQWFGTPGHRIRLSKKEIKELADE